MNKIIYVAFLAIATVKEIGEIFLFPPNGLIEILYIIGFLYVIIKMLTDSLPLWIWRNGYSIVGFSAILYLILRFFGIPNQPIDVFDSEKLKETVCFHSLEQLKFRSLLNAGFSDSYRIINPQKQEFSWWDYRNNSWNKNHGLRIDYLLTNPQANDCLINAELESSNVRDQVKASDHCPASITLKI